MNITFLVGNGFDIQQGLDTRYTDFYQSIEAEENQFYREIEKNPDNWSDFEYALGEYTKRFKEKIDEENEKNVKSTMFQRFFEDYNKVKNDLGDYIEKEESKFEVSSDGNKVKDTLDNFYKALEVDDRNIFWKLLAYRNDDDIVNVISFNYSSILDKAFNPLKNRIKLEWNRDNRHTQLGKFIHIHGEADRYLTLGVNDSSQIANDFFPENTLYRLVKPIEIKESRDSRDTEAENIIKTSEIIVIFGMSIGDTDAKWWNDINEWLSLDKKRLLLICAYEENIKSKRDASTYIECRRRWQERFVGFANYGKEENQEGFNDKVQNQIFISINQTTFFPGIAIKKEKIAENTLN
ncbi:AbiH family protein [Listeria booriae]|uniref:AbiH family protein n=1 Tax=Listeria booriae TaxID=1552123 RepID=UPI001629198D|nr:AbiH family protein [Listeria booriae]MBC2172949.1 hypothetical protein [Listeria booriae]